MKTLLAFLFCLLTLTAHAQAPWPRNPKTGKVEFTGVLPWPATAKTEAQRQALVKRWYLAKLTDSSPEAVKEDVRTSVSETLLTYARLPKIAQLKQGEPLNGYALLYAVNLKPEKEGLTYSLLDFTFSQRKESDATPIESHLATPVANEQAALAALRKRLAKALAGWN